MSATLRKAALIVGAVTLAATGVGAGIAIATGATLATGTAAVGTALGLGAGLVGTLSAVSSGLALAAGLSAKKPGSTSVGSPEQFAADPNAFIAYTIGRTALAGNIVWRRAWDTADKGENDRQAFLVDLGLGPIDAIEFFTVDNVRVNFNTAGQPQGIFEGFMWQTQQLGACPEPAALGWGTGAGNPPGWTAQHRLSGHAAAAWTLRFDTKAKYFQNGTPAPLWIVRGNKVWDPRRDSSYPGGSGACRALDESTYVYSENPYLHGLTWVLGRWQNGKRVMGIGAPRQLVDVAAFVEGANIADMNGWRVGGTIYSGDNKWDTLKKMLQAGMGEPMPLGARIACFVNAPKVSLDTITAADRVGAGSVTATQPRRDRINGVIARYRSEDHNWAMVPSAPIRVTTHVTEDGGERTKEIEYPLIQCPAGEQPLQVAVAARYDIENAREFGPIMLPLKIRWMGYKPGDCLTVNDPELGLNNQTILILSRDIDAATGMPTITARSETAAKHPFALGQTTVAPPTPGVTGPPLIPVPASWTIEATSITKGETTIPALIVSGFADSPIAEAIVFEFRTAIVGQAPDAGWNAAGIDAPNTTRKILEGVRPATAYEVAVSYRVRGVIGARLILGPVSVGALAVDFDFITGPNRPDDNATNSADPASPFGTTTVGGITQRIDDTKALVDSIQDAIENSDLGDSGMADAARKAAEAARDAAILARDAAAAQAQVAASESDEASNFATTAQGAARLADESRAGAAILVSAAARTSVGLLNPNANFLDYPTTGSPTGWSTNGDRIAGVGSPYAVRLFSQQAVTQADRTRIVGGGFLVVEVDVRGFGNLDDNFIGLQSFDDGGAIRYGNGWYLGHETPIDNGATRPVFGAVNGEAYRYRIFVDARTADARNWVIYLQNVGGGTFYIDRLGYRFATPGEVDGRVARDQLTSKADYSQLVQLGTDLRASVGQVSQNLTTELHRVDERIGSEVYRLDDRINITYSEATSRASTGYVDNAVSTEAGARASHERATVAEFSRVDYRISDAYQVAISRASNEYVESAVASEAGARAQAIAGQRVSYNGRSLLLQEFAGVLATPDGKLQGLWGVGFNNGTPVLSIYYRDDNGNIQQGAYLAGDLTLDGTLTARKIAARGITQQYGAVLGQELIGEPGYNWQAGPTINFYLDYDADVLVIGTGGHGYYGSYAGFESALAIDGSRGAAGGGNAGATGSYALAISMSGSIRLGAGWHSAQLQWRGMSSDIHLAQATLIVLRAYC